MKALFHTGFYTSHDGWHQVARLYFFNSALKDGQIPPRFSGDLLNGFGYPLFIFSYHLPWLLAQPLVLMGLSIFDAIKAVFVITYILSGISMYLFISHIWGKKAGLVSGLIYLYAPYRFANILVRANMGEAVSFIFFPLIFWGLWKLAKPDKKWGILAGSTGIAGALLSHLMVVYLFFLPISLFVLTILNKNKIKYLINVGITVLLGAGLAGYYLLPVVFYQPMTVFKQIYKNLYLNYFTQLKLLFYSPWGYGALGTSGEMSRQIGLVILIILCLSLICVIYFLLKHKHQKSIKYFLVFIISFIFTVFMMTKASAGFWKLLQPVVFIDFPWRFLAVTTFCGSVLGGILTNSFKNPLLQYIFMGFIFISLIYTNRNHIRVNQYTDIPLDLYIRSELTTNTDDEYLPKWVNRQYAKDEKIPLISGGNAETAVIKNTSNRLLFNYSLISGSEVSIHKMFFPGWTGFIDGKITPLLKNDQGGIKIQLPEGSHQFDLRYMPTPVMIIGEIISVVSILLIIFIELNKAKL